MIRHIAFAGLRRPLQRSCLPKSQCMMLQYVTTRPFSEKTSKRAYGFLRRQFSQRTIKFFRQQFRLLRLPFRRLVRGLNSIFAKLQQIFRHSSTLAIHEPRRRFKHQAHDENYQAAWARAKSESQFYDPQRLVFWTDASVQNTNAGVRAGIAVIWDVHAGKHKERGYWKDISKASSDYSELLAMFAATSIALKICQSQGKFGGGERGKVHKVVVYSDSRGALRRMLGLTKKSAAGRQPEMGEEDIAVKNLKESTKELGQLGVGVSFRWVPGHSGAKGNSLAHRVAYIAGGQDNLIRNIPAFDDTFWLKASHRLEPPGQEEKVSDRSPTPGHASPDCVGEYLTPAQRQTYVERKERTKVDTLQRRLDARRVTARAAFREVSEKLSIQKVQHTGSARNARVLIRRTADEEHEGCRSVDQRTGDHVDHVVLESRERTTYPRLRAKAQVED